MTWSPGLLVVEVSEGAGVKLVLPPTSPLLIRPVKENLQIIYLILCVNHIKSIILLNEIHMKAFENCCYKKLNPVKNNVSLNKITKQ